MTGPEQIAAKLTEAQKVALDLVCRTNGGGVQLRVRTGDDGYGVPTSPAYRKLQEMGLIQGKSGAYEMVVHTRDGLAVRQHLMGEGR